jgi:hypothetical protein
MVRRREHRGLFFFLQRSETRETAADLKTNTDVLATSVLSLPLLSINVAKFDLNTRTQSNLIFSFSGFLTRRHRNESAQKRIWDKRPLSSSIFLATSSRTKASNLLQQPHRLTDLMIHPTTSTATCTVINLKL